MSASMYWRPATPVEPLGGIDLPMRQVLAKRLLNSDDYSELDNLELGIEHLTWLSGVRDGGGMASEDATELITAIEKYKRIKFSIEY